MLFIHDHCFFNYNEEYYTKGTLNNDFFNNYLDIYDNILIISTQKKIKNKKLLKNSEKIKKNKKIKMFLLNKNKRIRSIAYNLKSIVKIVRRENHIIIRMPSLNGIIVGMICLILKKRYLVEVVGCSWDSLVHHSLKGKIVAPFFTLISKFLIKKSFYANYVTKYFLQRRYPTEGKKIGCSDVILKNQNELILEGKIKKLKKIGIRKKIKIGTIGNIDLKYKGQKTVIKAISQINNCDYDFEYILVGSGQGVSLKKYIEKLGLRKKIVFLGMLSHEEVFKFLKEIDVYIQPSETEGLPRALIEAMSYACPILASKVGGIPELVEKKYLFNKNDYKSLKQMLENLNTSELIRQSERNFYYSLEYSYETLKETRKKFYKEFYKEVIGS